APRSAASGRSANGATTAAEATTCSNPALIGAGAIHLDGALAASQRTIAMQHECRADDAGSRPWFYGLRSISACNSALDIDFSRPRIGEDSAACGSNWG